MQNFKCIHNIVALLFLLCLPAAAYADSAAPAAGTAFRNMSSAISPSPPSSPVQTDPPLKLSAGMTFDPQEPILPEITTTVRLSSSDVNRIICPVEIKDIPRSSGEKGVIIEFAGRNAWVKFKGIKQGDGKLVYAATPTEIFVNCAGAVYSLIALPSRIPAQTIRLGSGRETRIKENNALFEGLPFEKKVYRLIREAYTDSLPDSYLVTRPNNVDTSYKGLIIATNRDIAIEGEGLRLKELHVSLKPGQTPPFKLSEKQFLREFTENPVAIAMDKHTLQQPGDVSRVFIVEQTANKTGISAINLPVVDNSAVSPPAVRSQQSDRPPGVPTPKSAPPN